MMMINISIWIKNFDYETFEQIELMLMNFTRYFHHFIHTHVNQLFFVGCDFIFHSFRCHSIHFSLSILLLLTTITKKIIPNREIKCEKKCEMKQFSIPFLGGQKF